MIFQTASISPRVGCRPYEVRDTTWLLLYHWSPWWLKFWTPRTQSVPKSAIGVKFQYIVAMAKELPPYQKPNEINQDVWPGSQHLSKLGHVGILNAPSSLSVCWSCPNLASLCSFPGPSLCQIWSRLLTVVLYLPIESKNCGVLTPLRRRTESPFTVGVAVVQG